jgi:hypothetical protein
MFPPGAFTGKTRKAVMNRLTTGHERSIFLYVAGADADFDAIRLSRGNGNAES